MSDFWVILWEIIKYTALIGCIAFFVLFLIAVFHPIYLTLSGRASIKGQRGEVKLSYLFGLLHLRLVASANVQEIWLEFCKFRKLLQREGGHQLKKESSQTDQFNQEKTNLDVTEDKEKNELPPEVYDAIESEIETETETEIQQPVEEISEQQTISESEELKEEIKTETKEELTTIEETKPVDDLSPKGADSELDNSLDDNQPKVEATPEQLAELQAILEEEERKELEEAKKSEQKKKDGWEAKLRKFKKDFNRRYDQLRGKLRLVKQKWNSLWPVAKRFWNRGKKGFKFHDARLKVNYSLEDHYLTGMLYGYLAPTIGFAKKYGLEFMPVPVFPNEPEAGIYSKASWSIDIRPHMFIWAIIGLLFEKNLYKELIWLYKYKKNKKNK